MHYTVWIRASCLALCHVPLLAASPTPVRHDPLTEWLAFVFDHVLSDNPT